MKFELTLHGFSDSPIVFHRGDLADSQDEYARAMKKITDKRNKTDEDKAEIDSLSWRGSLYVEDDKIVYPAFNVWRSIQEAAKLTKHGRHIERALTFDSRTVPFNYTGPDDIDVMYKDSRYVWRAMVRVGQSKVARVRPRFDEWFITLTGELDVTELNFDEFREIVERAGRVVGLGDARRLGYGRFDAEVKEL